MKSLRQEFADTVLDLGSECEELVVFVGDISHGILQPFAKQYPDRYYNIGICEPTMVNMAAGLSMAGLIPVVHTIAPFLIERSFEQIKLDFGYQNLGVNLVSVGGAFDYPKLGCSHHCYSDVALLSQLERSQIFLPGTASEFRELFSNTFDDGMINYYRLSENPHEVPIESEMIVPGSAVRVLSGDDLTLAVVGPQLSNAVEVAPGLAEDGISVELLYFTSLKPFDSDALQNSVEKTRTFLTVEELSTRSGLFDQCLRSSAGVDGLRFGQLAIPDFVHTYGTYQELCMSVGLDKDGIRGKILELLGTA
jgi:transketolase